MSSPPGGSEAADAPAATASKPWIQTLDPPKESTPLVSATKPTPPTPRDCGACLAYLEVSMRALWFSSRLNLLLLCAPLAIVTKALYYPADSAMDDDALAASSVDDAHGKAKAIIFTFAMLALVPLAERLGFVTDQLSLYTNQVIAGLLNVTCGNVPELVMVLVCLKQDELRIIRYSMIGGILSNLLLVAGLSFFFGGLFHRQQKYTVLVSQTFLMLLLLSVVVFMMAQYLPDAVDSYSAEGAAAPTRLHAAPLKQLGGAALIGASRSPPLAGRALSAAHHQQTVAPDLPADTEGAELPGAVRTTDFPELAMSRAFALLLLIAYLCVVVFQMITHRDEFEEDDDGGGGKEGGDATKAAGDEEAGGKEAAKPSDGGGGQQSWCCQSSCNTDDDDDDDEPVLGLYGSCFWMLFICLALSYLSDMLVDTIEGAAQELSMSQLFLSGVILPNVNNAPEHAVAIIFAVRGKLNTSVSIAVGSAAQLATFILPIAVLVGWAMGRDLSLELPPIEQAAYVSAVLLVGFTLSSGRTTWLTGAILICAYLLIACGFWTTPVEHHLGVELYGDGVVGNANVSAGVVEQYQYLGGQTARDN